MTTVEKTEDSLSLTREKIKNYHFLEQLLTSFQAEFVNLNQDLRDRYSNYYVDTMPLLLDDNNISFRLYHINFDKITRLIKSTPQAILGITLKVTIPYKVRFKELYNDDIINNVVVISNNLDVLSNI
ncbi:hypothetical protein [Spiroplasma endosymbiont of Ammophila pubescens]|uniref:hypothetical protein n=1 Tax=Spiroplasma endosymbiont of Ammophila pubescens TaxID=3066315 RepID=UPI0032B23473